MKLKRHEPPCLKKRHSVPYPCLYKLRTILCPHLLHRLRFSEAVFKIDRTTSLGVSLAIIRYERWFTAALNFDGIYELSVEKIKINSRFPAFGVRLALRSPIFGSVSSPHITLLLFTRKWVSSTLRGGPVSLRKLPLRYRSQLWSRHESRIACGVPWPVICGIWWDKGRVEGRWKFAVRRRGFRRMLETERAASCLPLCNCKIRYKAIRTQECYHSKLNLLAG